MAVTKYIPLKITYVHSKVEVIEEYWEDSDEIMSKCKVAPTWPIETGKSLDKAIEWAGGKSAKTKEVDNSPIDNVKVVGLEPRGNGGRAYKVVIDDLYYVDMREDVILDIIFQTGIQAGGKLNGEFIWVKYGSNLKLIRIGSALHKEFVKGTERINTFVDIKPKDVVIGGLYETKGGKTLLYLGKVNVFNHYYESYRGGGHERNNHIVLEKQHMFLEYHSWDKVSKNANIEGYIKALGSSVDYHIKFQGSIPKFVNKVKQVEDVTNPEDVAKIVRIYSIKHAGSNPYSHNYHWPHLTCSVNEPVLPEILSYFKLPVFKKPYENI